MLLTRYVSWNLLCNKPFAVLIVPSVSFIPQSPRSLQCGEIFVLFTVAKKNVPSLTKFAKSQTSHLT